MQTFLSVVFKYEEKINTFIDDLYKQKGKLIMRKKEISMIILAGGASSRMGQDKSDLTIDGKTFLEMQIEKGESLESVIFFCLAIMVKININIPLYQTASREKVQLGGLEACFRKAKNPYCLVLGVDVPWFRQRNWLH